MTQPEGSVRRKTRAGAAAASLIAIGAALIAAPVCAADVQAKPRVAAAAARSPLSGVWISRNKALPDGVAAGFPLQLSSTDWIPLSAGRVEGKPIESYASQKAAVEKVIAANGDVFAYERSRRKPPPYSAAGEKAVAELNAAQAASAGKPRNPYDQCLPRNTVSIVGAIGGFGGAIEIFDAGDHVGVVSDQGDYRMARLGRVDASMFTPGYAGISVGRWDGGRLVVVTTNFLGDTANGWPMSPQARVTDTLWVSPDRKTLNIKTVYEDPVNLKEPVARMTYLDRGAIAYEFLPTSCVETVQGAAEYAATFGATPP